MKATVQKLVVALAMLCVAGMAKAAAPVADGDTLVYANVVYETGSRYWKVLGHTLQPGCSEADRRLDIVLFQLPGWMGDDGYPDHTYKAKIFQREAFANDTLVKEVSGADGWCESKAFYNTPNLEIYDISFDGVAFTMPDSVFMNSGLKQFLDFNQRYFGNSYFEGTSRLDSIRIEEIVAAGKNMFKDSGVRKARIDRLSLSALPEGMFENSRLETLDLWASEVTGIGRRAFKNCRLAVADNVLMGKVTSVADEAFAESPLEEVAWPDGLKSIGARAFKSTSLKEVRLSPVIESIGEGAFADCQQLTAVYVMNPVPPAIVWDAAEASRRSLPLQAKVYVPDANVNDYLADPAWKNYVIVGQSESTGLGAVVSDGDAIRVEGGRIVAEGNIEVYTPDGRLVATGYADELPALPSGLYIVRTSAATAKIALR